MLDREVENTFRVELLKNEFTKRVSRNSMYSLRCFARDLDVQPGALSQFLNFKRNISDRYFDKITIGLNLDESSLNLAREEFFFGKRNKIVLKEEQYDLLRNWVYLGILELTTLDGFLPEIKWISDKLNIDEELCREAIKNLFATGALKEESGKWIDTFENVTFITDENMVVECQRSFQKQILDRANTSIEMDSAEAKSHSSIMGGIDLALIPEVKARIKKFRRETQEYIEQNSKKKNSVYNLNLNFFQLSRSE